MRDIKNYAVVTAAYWGFTITDGALRMLVLLHFHALGYTPVELAFLFLLYEVMGVLTNFVGGWIGARYGLRLTLFAGLTTQIVALLMLAALPAGLTLALSVAYVMAAQALSGVAKDLTKMSSKSAVKLVVAEESHGLLFKWVALLTGSKNALKGVGFFVGGFLLASLGFVGALIAMAAGLAVILILSVLRLTSELGKAKEKIRGRDLFSKSREINWLSAARIFLFASRDVWFVVGLPVYLAGVTGWSFDAVGAFMAAWVIGYGIVQALVPKALKSAHDSTGAAHAARTWGSLLALLTFILALGMTDKGQSLLANITPVLTTTGWLIPGLMLFGILFAVNSALHSYLIVAYSDNDKVSLNVGFYYTANALGRLAGTLLSGLIYQYAGLVACLFASGAMISIAALLTLPLTRSPAQGDVA
ncbi:organoarsenical effux MFS transporter ArsJ [Kordiimonas marina]|uniref:organoarsenical effux MFS transporter ArsJ n=1 Tax=Kordiimonas marina TaxID=2872312 RepID=UPI001FF33342|nr:organoarsenical effux MFS transporter ArsJ [Kordiimonas marina]MCJ9429185.1 organoarsenical effux MFS transporter ArsJ [Kordiimonas marina]